MKIDAFGVEEWMNAYETEARWNIAETCVESLTVRELLELTGEGEEGLRAIAETKLTYGDIPGSPGLREAVAGLYRTVTPDRVLITGGGIGANFLVHFALVDPGDEVVAILPTYQQLHSVPEAFGAVVRRLVCRPEAGFRPDPDELDRLVTDRTKLIVLNFPNNPTGANLTEEDWKRIVAAARRVGAYIHGDEIYRGLEHGAPYGSASVADRYERGISTGSVSKVYSLAGLRTGWIAGPDEVIAACFSRRDYTTISCGRIDDGLAARAIRNREAILGRNLPLVRRNLALLDQWVAGQPRVRYVRPVSGTTALLFFETGQDSVSFCRDLFEFNGTFLVPGACFGLEQCARIGYAPATETLIGGLEGLSDYLKGAR